MKSYYLLLLAVVTIALASLTGCNNEAPTDITPYDQNAEVKWTSEPYKDSNGVVVCWIYREYFPSSWSGSVGKNLPWTQFTQNGKYFENDLATPRDEFKNYFHQEFWADFNTEVIIFLRYGKDATDKTNKAIIPLTSKYAVEYNPTNAYDKITKKPQKEVVLAFRLYQGVVTPIDLSIMKPLQTNVIVPPKIIINKEQDYWLDNTKYTEAVGIEKNNIVWEFPDGTLCYGWNIKNTIYVYDEKIKTTTGDLTVTIEDNLGKITKLKTKITAVR